jgi:8-amino-7-oxononanoate synthase
VPDAAQSRIETRAARELDDLRDQAQLRRLENLSGIDLCSNDYLGLATDLRLKQAVAEAVAKAKAVGSAGSRLLSGNTPEWEALESEFARFAQTDAALYFGSGYSANVGLLSSILKSGDVVFSDAFNHASLIDGIRLSRATKVIYPHADMHFLERALREHSQSTGAKVIVTESVFSMEGDIAPITSLLGLARGHGAELILDEAHATGVLGPEGRGLAAEHRISRETLAIVHTCGKALASAGAFVCCNATLKNYLVNRARTFIFSTAMPPYFAGQIRAALHLAMQSDAERAHLLEIGNLLREELSAMDAGFGASATQIIPVLCGSNESALRIAAHLQTNGFAAKAIRPPTVPAGMARVRISLTAKITREDVQRFALALRTAFQSLPQSQSASVVHA